MNLHYITPIICIICIFYTMLVSISVKTLKIKIFLIHRKYDVKVKVKGKVVPVL